MSKKVKSNLQEQTNVAAEVEVEQTAKVAQATNVAPVADKKKTDKKKMNKNKKNPQEKGKFKRKAKETISEVKKVSWPTFGEVCKRTGVVLVVVLVFAIVIFGIDFGLGQLVGLLRK